MLQFSSINFSASLDVQVVCLEIAPVTGKVSPVVHAPRKPLPPWRANAVIAWMPIPYSF